MKPIGFWKEFRTSTAPSLFQNGSLKKRTKIPNEKVLKYLKNGVWLDKLRTWFNCPIDGTLIRTPTTYTDGEWVWTTEFIYYYEHYDIDISLDFVNYMENSNYRLPMREQLGESLINDMAQKIAVISSG